MTVIEEGNLEFTFGPTWRVHKYDENGAYYKSQFESKLRPTKAIDFLCFHDDSALLMLEVKDFSLGVPNLEKVDRLPWTVAIKARDTIAGIIGGSNQASNPHDRLFFRDSHRRLKTPPRVLFLYEDLAVPSRQDPRRTMNKRDVLLKQLREHLRWLTQDIAVIGLNDYKQFINDLTIRRL